MFIRPMRDKYGYMFFIVRVIVLIHVARHPKNQQSIGCSDPSYPGILNSTCTPKDTTLP